MQRARREQTLALVVARQLRCPRKLTRELLNREVLPNRIYPMLGQAFQNSLPNWRALRVADAFIVK